ncbi:hypothetical protein P4H46_14625 [Paenibacillus glucanolyticus]|uniref:hypothetical protein n=1 Tax=Paenibacillus glucanolyticus TaxID=59843 RepID=UPI0030C9045D
MLKKSPDTDIYERPTSSFDNTKSIRDIFQEGLIRIDDKGVIIVDNRTYNVSGITGQNQNINLGDHSTTNQSIHQLGNSDIDSLFEKLKQFAIENSNPQDVQMIESVKENVKSGKFETAKTVFDLLTKAVQASAAGVAIAKAFSFI